ncbi:MAG TPA: protein kinase [Solirubrobacteraceae bacterium]|nr:protein kinase [Solirubrobacteraceae bacterium]
MSTHLGTSLSGRYRLDQQIGTGGMSTVYRAFDTVLERQVAVKLMHRDMAGHADQLERFRREARSVAQLNHPHIVQVIDAGEDENMPYIVFEYVEGETLKDRIRRFGRLPVPEAIAYAIEIAWALGAAHDRGIVHRDVKPQNVLVDEEGSAKVTDFGIARTLDQEGLTADGRVLGTTDYVSPEQALGHAVTGQSDLYSLGVVLYEMLTGDVPFHGENQVAVAMKHVREELPDLQYRRPEVSSALAAVLDRMTAKDLSVRYHTTHELMADLEDVFVVESARAGQTTGEATQVLRALPQPKRSRLPLRMRTSMLAFVAFLLLAAAATVTILVVAADRTQRGTGAVRDSRPPAPDLASVSLGARAATDFDPIGGDGEHGDEAFAVLDRDQGTIWTTETYSAGDLQKDGVGISLDAKTDDGGGILGRRLVVRTKTPGFTAAVYGAVDGRPEVLDGWTLLASPRKIDGTEQVELDNGGRRYRHYLLWITELAPDDTRVEISELELFSAAR